MARLFANKFNLDQLPDPVKPSTAPVQASNIRIEPIEQKPLETQALNAQLQTVDNQKANIPTSDEILARQGVRKSSSTQYVSSTKVEPFGTTPVNQGGTDIKPPKEVENKTSNVVVNQISNESIITVPNVSFQKVDQGSKITDPNTIIHKTNPGEKITNPHTVVNKIDQGDHITNPNTTINEVKAGDRITDPNTQIKKVNANEFIVNPNTVIKKAEGNEYIKNPNTVINKIEAGNRIVNPKTVISKVKVGELITMPNIVLSQMRPTDVRDYQPNLTGNGNTKLFPRYINLENRLKQALLGTTKHLPEYILSDQNTGILTISSPNVIAKISAVKIQRLEYSKFILKQGGVEDILKGITSYINPFRFGEKKPNQGSITIKNNQRFVDKTSPVHIKKLSELSKITNPKLIIKPLQVGSRTVDPKIRINKDQKVEIITNPQIAVELPKANLIRDPRLEVKLPPTTGELTIDPNIKPTKVIAGSKITIPKIKVSALKKSGELTTIPKFKLSQPSKPGTSVKNPKTQIAKVAVGSRTFDPKIKPNVVKPGSRTTIPRLVLPLSTRTGNVTDPLVKIVLFDNIDNKTSFTLDVPLFGDIRYNGVAVFPSDNNIPPTGLYVENTKFDPYAILPDNQPTAAQSAIINGTQYSNHYAGDNGNVFDYTDQNSPLKKAGAAPVPTLTVTYYDGSPITQQLSVTQPQAVYADSTTPGGYKALTYTQMQARQQRNNRRNLDYAYNEATSADEAAYWRTRLGMPDSGADTLNTSVDATKNDFVKIVISSGRGDGTIQFRSYLKAFNDTITPQYTDVNYVGRPDTLKVFKGTTRQVGLGFIVPAFSKDELNVIYQKLNKLVRIAGTGKYTANSVYVQGPFLKITVGNWLVNTPAIAGSIKFDTNPTEYSWDVNYEVPQIVDVSLDLTILSSNDATPFLSDGKYINYGG